MTSTNRFVASSKSGIVEKGLKGCSHDRTGEIARHEVQYVERREWGRRDPLWGVASWPDRQRGGPHPWTLDEFYATGAADWEFYRSHWIHYVLDRSCCLEIGCGAGQLTAAMSKDFDTIHGVDVSADILELARQRVPAKSVSFHQTDGLTIPLPDGTATAVLSKFVFQHFDAPPLGARYLAEIHRVMAPNATMMIQLPVFVSPMASSLVRRAYAVQRWFGQRRADMSRRRMARGGAPIMRGLKHEVSWLHRTLTRIGFSDIELRIFPAIGNATGHSLVRAKKRAEA